MENLFRKLGNTFLFFCHLDPKYFFAGVKLLLLQFSYYVCRTAAGQQKAFDLLRNIEVVISLKKTKFSVPAIPDNLGFIMEVFIKKSYELVDSFVPGEGDTCLDIGATTGECGLSWHIHNSSGTIICCEPHPYTFKRLQKNIALNNCSNIEALQIAISSENTPIEIFYDQYFSMAVAESKTKKSTCSVEAQTIDSLMKERHMHMIDICKIDVEGYEVEVLKGAAGALKKIKKLIIECHSESLTQQVKEILDPHFKIIKEIGIVHPVLFAERNG
jgi:FkbM family methyltransferase